MAIAGIARVVVCAGIENARDCVSEATGKVVGDDVVLPNFSPWLLACQWNPGEIVCQV
ncbi:hypothetical protein NTGBS_170011 [Candidatus Nitrotoga sp. BS]|nr:hypothetical protein NTGBS_170011 [Candidatus Nitrotoga sp. BS]